MAGPIRTFLDSGVLITAYKGSPSVLVAAINVLNDPEAAGIRTPIGNHIFRATGITAYLKNGGRLEIAQQMANHESLRTARAPLSARRRDHARRSGARGDLSLRL